MPDKDTLYDKRIKKILNNKRLVGIIVPAAIVVAVLTFLGTVLEQGTTIKEFFFPQKEQTQIVISMKPYDVITGETQTKPIFNQSYILGDHVDIESVSSSTESIILDAIQPRTKPELDLEIIKNHLHAYETVVASISFFQSPLQTLTIKEFNQNSDLNLDEIFQPNSNYYNPTCNCISLYIEDKAGQLKPKYMEIFKKDQDYSFDAESVVIKKTIVSEITPTIILIAPFVISGTNSENGEQIRSVIESSLREKLQKHKFIQISALSLEKLQGESEKLQKLPTNIIKQDIVEQYNVDFIVSGEIIVTNEP